MFIFLPDKLPSPAFLFLITVAALNGGGIGFGASSSCDPVRDWPRSGSISTYVSQIRALAELPVAASPRPEGGLLHSWHVLFCLLQPGRGRNHPGSEQTGP